MRRTSSPGSGSAAPSIGWGYEELEVILRRQRFHLASATDERLARAKPFSFSREKRAGAQQSRLREYAGMSLDRRLAGPLGTARSRLARDSQT